MNERQDANRQADEQARNAKPDFDLGKNRNEDGGKCYCCSTRTLDYVPVRHVIVLAHFTAKSATLP